MQNDRIRQIMTILLQEKKVIAKDLAVRFGVSLESIRRDLSQLEQQGTVRKFYGGAALVEELLPDGEAEVFQVRLTEHGAQKQAIARAGGDTAMGAYTDAGLTLFVMIPMVFALALFTDVGPVVLYCGVKLVDVIKVVVFHF